MESPPQPIMDDKETPPKSPSESDETRETMKLNIQQLLDEMQTAFQSFSENIFTKIDSMQQKIDDLEQNVKKNLSVNNLIKEDDDVGGAGGADPGIQVEGSADGADNIEQPLPTVEP